MPYRYLIKRLLIFIPAIFIISIIGFIISINVPGDPVDRMLSGSGDEPQTNKIFKSDQYVQLRKQLGLDLPVFYFSVQSLAEPDTINRVANKQQREWLLSLCRQCGNWKEVCNFYLTVNKGIIAYSNDIGMQQQLLQLFSSSKIASLEKHISVWQNDNSSLTEIKNAFNDLQNNKSVWKAYIPVLTFHSPNQYQNWLFGNDNLHGAIRGDFGVSYINHQLVGEKIKQRYGWTLFFSLTSVLLAYIISIPIGVKAGSKPGSKFDKVSTTVLFLLYSLPGFWFATLLLMLFANPDVLQIFPVSGIKPAGGYPVDSSLWDRIWISIPYLILPLIAYTYSSIAFISRLLRSTMQEVMSKEYIKTARAKGLSERTVLYRHAFRNSLLPLITVFGNIFPALLSGSVILEMIFSISGMGAESVMAVQNFDYPVIVAVFTISGVLALTGYLIADILYAIVDPRIRYE